MPIVGVYDEWGVLDGPPSIGCQRQLGSKGIVVYAILGVASCKQAQRSLNNTAYSIHTLPGSTANKGACGEMSACSYRVWC